MWIMNEFTIIQTPFIDKYFTIIQIFIPLLCNLNLNHVMFECDKYN